MPSFIPEVQADLSGKWCGNGCRFATQHEADEYLEDLACRWTAVRATRAVPSADPPNYVWQDGRAVALEQKGVSRA
jgi:hypothetical protein